MATFPTWILKKNSPTNSSGFNKNNSLSPRQIANKAYTLSSKKLNRDERQSKPQYSIRERLLISQTMLEAEALLNKRKARHNRRVMAFEDEDEYFMSRTERMTIPPPPQPLAQQVKNDTKTRSHDILPMEELDSTILTPSTTIMNNPTADNNQHQLIAAAISTTPDIALLSMQQERAPDYLHSPSKETTSLIATIQESDLIISLNAVMTAAAVTATAAISPIIAFDHQLLSNDSKKSLAAEQFHFVDESRPNSIINIPSFPIIIANQIQI
ncbi:hypothetical protein BDF20DRAFT_877400 [Mycotypha africana]|uniref:uncharacterized protein n=1 Tax=Mycotypha africana TaxID=64632 RepID=UPI002301EAA0|nr:uncharacterized protein BDF20DRAFT_877400 [Mycotypha africana]KAI8975206.1 hypothetical protein BDF20DRAFT_877400 [Mycotypha africana]